MFKKNIGSTERILRIVVGAALLAGFFLLPDFAYRYWLLIGIIPLATGLINSCALYSLLGISTRKDG